MRQRRSDLAIKKELARITWDLEANPFSQPAQVYVVALQHEINKIELYEA